MDDNNVHTQSQQPEIYHDLKSTLSYFEGFIDNDQDRLTQEVKKIAPDLKENTFSEIIKECHKRQYSNKSGYKRLCGTFLIWKKEQDPKFSLKKFAEQNLSNKGARLSDYTKIVKNWNQIQILATEQGKDAYKISFNALEKLYEEVYNDNATKQKKNLPSSSNNKCKLSNTEELVEKTERFSNTSTTTLNTILKNEPTTNLDLVPNTERSKAPSSSRVHIESTERTELQWIFAKLGFQKGYSSWISPQAKIYENESLDSLNIKTLPQLEISDEAKQEIQFIDIIWVNKNHQVIQAFCIENDEKLISSRLLQVADFILLEKIPFNLVVPKSMEEKAKAELSRRAFQSLGLEHRCNLTMIEDWQEAWKKKDWSLIQKKKMILFAEDVGTALAGKEVSPSEYADTHLSWDSESINNDEELTRKPISQSSARNNSYPSPQTSKEVDEFAMNAAMNQVGCKYPNEEIDQMGHNNPGYDILVEKDGEVVTYVEVKGTKKPKPTFYMSEYERRFSKNNAEKYLLIIVYNINLNTGKYHLDSYQGDINVNDKFKFKPVQWSVQVD